LKRGALAFQLLQARLRLDALFLQGATLLLQCRALPIELVSDRL
jgi:hypothetical protein